MFDAPSAGRAVSAPLFGQDPALDRTGLPRACDASPLHVYVHFPWCLEKCPYCDFVSFKSTRAAIDHHGYADAILRELDARAPAIGAHQLRTIFIGGGTPSLWEPAALGRVIRALVERWGQTATGPSSAPPSAPPIEVTAECNPSSLDAAVVEQLAAAGVNRWSIGIQSLDDDQLRFLGRLHDARRARQVLDAAVAFGGRVSADLIFGLPGQPASVAAQHAGELVDRGVHHVSAYALTLEPGTRFGELARRGRLPIAPEDSVCDAFLEVERALEGRGLRHYEVSNYARPGQEARHNLGVWRGESYLGLGCAAVGCLPLSRDERAEGAWARRYRNRPSPTAYLEGTRTVRTGAPAAEDGLTEFCEDLDPQTLLRERIMLGMRLAEGLDLTSAGAAVGLGPEAVWTPARSRAVARLLGEGRLEQLDGSGADLEARVGRLRIPARARLGTDGVCAALF